ncbi:MAG: PAS domain S-box protein [Woeseiaceae bacterium]|nr:PAS domain S-box protein [Woeseiaceae bacterium]
MPNGNSQDPQSGLLSPEVPDGFFRKVLEAMSDVVLVTDAEGRFRFVCPNVESVTGVPPDHVAARGNVGNVLDPDPAEHLDAQQVSVLMNVPTRLMGPDGDAHELLCNVRRCDIDGDSRLYVGRSLSEFDVAARLLQRIFGHAQDAILFISPSGRRIVDCNPAAATLLGYDKQDLVGSSTEKIHIDRESFLEYGRLSAADIQEGGSFQTRYRLRHRDGYPLDVDIRTVAIDTAAADSLGFISIIHDVSKQCAAEDALAMVHGVVRKIMDCRTVKEALLPMLNAICRRSDWAVGEAWLNRDDSPGTFERVADIAREPAASTYLKRTTATVADLQDPLVGRAATTRQPVVVDDLSATPGTPRTC